MKDSEDANEKNGLTLDLNDSASKETIKYLREFKWNYTKKDGLACASRGVSGWNSDDDLLGRSSVFGRVFVVRAEGAKDRRYSLEAVTSALTTAGIEGEPRDRVIASLPSNIVI